MYARKFEMLWTIASNVCEQFMRKLSFDFSFQQHIEEQNLRKDEENLTYD